MYIGYFTGSNEYDPATGASNITFSNTPSVAKIITKMARNFMSESKNECVNTKKLLPHIQQDMLINVIAIMSVSPEVLNISRYFKKKFVNRNQSHLFKIS